MLEQRAKLEPEISEEDKKLIADLRIEFEKKRAEKKARFEQKGEKGKNGECEGKNGKRKEGAKNGNDENREKMKSLVEKYKGDIEPLFEEVADQQEKWKNDILEITKNTLELDDEEMERFKQRGKGRHGEQAEMMKMGRFLLLDPSEKSESTLILKA